MKKLILFTLLIFSLSSYCQTIRKYNSSLDRYEFYDSNRQLVSYVKYDSLQERWKFFDSNGQMYAYSKYNSLTGETEFVELNSNNSNSGRHIIHDYGEPSSTFDSDLALFALKYGRRQSNNYVKIGKPREVNLNKHTLNFKMAFDGLNRKEIAYQLRTTNKARLEILGGISSFDSYDTYKILSNYQWVSNFIGYLNFYAGVGLGMEKVSTDEINFYDTLSGSYFLGYGVLGVEYNFKIPLIIFIDYDINYNYSLIGGVGVGLRYGFNF